MAITGSASASADLHRPIDRIRRSKAVQYPTPILRVRSVKASHGAMRYRASAKIFVVCQCM